MTLLIGVHYFYQYHKQKQGLLAAFKAMNIKGILPPKVTGTRWLPHITRAISSLRRNYPAYVAHFNTGNHVNAKAESLAKILQIRHIMAFTLVLQVNSIIFVRI